MKAMFEVGNMVEQLMRGAQEHLFIGISLRQDPETAASQVHLRLAEIKVGQDQTHHVFRMTPEQAQSAGAALIAAGMAADLFQVGVEYAKGCRKGGADEDANVIEHFLEYLGGPRVHDHPDT